MGHESFLREGQCLPSASFSDGRGLADRIACRCVVPLRLILFDQITVIGSTTFMIETFVKTDGCYIGIFDLGSKVHEEERMHSGWKQAKALTPSDKSWATLFHFNELFIDRARQGEMLSWTLVFDGLFKVRIEVM